MLIICTECGHKVSDKADRCPDCGCPVSEILKCLKQQANEMNQDLETTSVSENSLFCNINGKKTDITWIKENVDNLNENEFKHYKYIWSKMMISLDERVQLLEKYCNTPEDVFQQGAVKLSIDVKDKCDLDSFSASRFLYELVDSDFQLKEFSGKSYTESKAEQQREMASTIRCPYCGSIDVKPLGFFDGGWSAVGNNWKCKNCKSYF